MILSLQTEVFNPSLTKVAGMSIYSAEGLCVTVLQNAEDLAYTANRLQDAMQATGGPVSGVLFLEAAIQRKEIPTTLIDNLARNAISVEFAKTNDAIREVEDLITRYESRSQQAVARMLTEERMLTLE